jgi:hypothetical protein
VNQDDVDTAPVFTKEGRVEYDSTDVGPEGRATLSLHVSKLTRSPTLFASSDPRDVLVVVEEVSCDGVKVGEDAAPLESLRFGRKLDATLAEGVTLRVTVRNDSDQDVRVGVSLVSAELVDEK